MELELLNALSEITLWFKAAAMLAIVLGIGFGAAIAMVRHLTRENYTLHDCLKEAHRAADEAEEGHRIALATLAEKEKRIGDLSVKLADARKRERV